jgi:2-polyprenyl-6-methoxyphenol hydroxylase-like FAD-dependent oxidoreductase
MKGARVSPFYNIEVWDGSGPGYIHFDNQGNPETELGYIIENRVIQAALTERMKALPSVDVLCPSQVKSIEQKLEDEEEDDWVTVVTADGRRLRTRLLVGADGGNSIVRNVMNIGSTGWSYGQRGIVCTVEHSVPNTTAWQRFLPFGPVALLPVRCYYISTANIFFSFSTILVV